jgi:hypothetical protein
MNTFKGTPGDWHFLEAYSHDDEYSACNPLTICSDSDDDLASIYSSADSTVSIPREQAIANATAIAAVPQLIAALEKIESGSFPGLSTMAVAGNWRGIATMYQQIARAALAAATGGKGE